MSDHPERWLFPLTQVELRQLWTYSDGVLTTKGYPFPNGDTRAGSWALVDRASGDIQGLVPPGDFSRRFHPVDVFNDVPSLPNYLGTVVAPDGTALANLLGLVVEVEGLTGMAAIGDRLGLRTRDGRIVPAEVIGFREPRCRRWHSGRWTGSPTAAQARLHDQTTPCWTSPSWLGRVIDPLGNPIDGKGILFGGATGRPTRAAAPEATARARVGPRIDLGVRALNCFATCRQGQRLGLFAGSGVGKSTLLSMLTLGTQCDVVVLALVGERGREVREFIENDLGPDGMARSVVVVATSDSPPLMRRQCAYTAMTVAEHFRDQGLSVLLLMDSVTRFCLALREIGLSLGEPPATGAIPPACSPNCRGCWSARARGRCGRMAAPGTSPGFSPCWWKATTRTNRWPTRCAASWTGTS